MKLYWSMSMLDKFQKTLGLAQRAGKCVTGEVLEFEIDKKRISLVLLANNASERTKREMYKRCEKVNVDCIELLSKEELSNAIGKFNRAAVGVADAGFSKLLKSYLKKTEVK